MKDLLYYNLFELLYNFFTGNWHEIKEYDEDLVDLNLRIGASWHLLSISSINRGKCTPNTNSFHNFSKKSSYWTCVPLPDAI